MRFDYYYGSQADQFSFIRIPKLLLTDKEFADLSVPSKLLYAILLDRMELSMKNGWFDEENRVYIIYQIKDIMDDLGFTKKKAMDYLAELVDFGLIEKKKRGFGLPNILYVKSFIVNREYSRSVEMGTSVAITSGFRGSQFNTSEVSKTAPKGIENSTSEVSESTPLEVPEQGPLYNNTNINNTNFRETESNHTSSADDELEIRFDPEIIYKGTSKMVKVRIEYDLLLKQYPGDHDLINGIHDLIVETMISKKEEILISGDMYPKELVYKKLQSLRFEHIQYVIWCFKENHTDVKNIKKYLLAMLFNAPSTIQGFYQAKYGYDMANIN